MNRDEVIKGLRKRLRDLEHERALLEAALAVFDTPPEARGYTRYEHFRDWARKQKAPFTVGDACAAFGRQRATVAKHFRRMEKAGTITDTGERRGREALYTFVKPVTGLPKAQRSLRPGNPAGREALPGTGRRTSARVTRDKEVQKLIKDVEANGYSVHREGGHLKVARDGVVVSSFGSTPSDSRSVKNTRAALRRQGILS